MSYDDLIKDLFPFEEDEVSGEAYAREKDDLRLEQSFQIQSDEERKEVEDQLEMLRRLGTSKYGKVNYRRSAQMPNHFNQKDLRLTDEDLERLGYNKDGKLVTTVQLTRTRFAEEKDPLSEEVDPMRIAWVKPYIYSPKYQTGIIILFNNGDFRTYTQSFDYFKHKVQQIVGNRVLVGGKVPSLPWWSEE